MQLGSLLRSGRRRGLDIWEFRYRDRRHNGRRIYRRIKIGTVQQFRTEASARKGIAGLVREINFGEIRFTTTTMTVAELVEHYRQRELLRPRHDLGDDDRHGQRQCDGDQNRDDHGQRHLAADGERGRPLSRLREHRDPAHQLVGGVGQPECGRPALDRSERVARHDHGHGRRRCDGRGQWHR